MYKNLYTVLGLLAILLWSSTIGISRILIEKLGLVTSITSVYLLSGFISVLSIFSRKKNRDSFRTINTKYLFICGSLFVVYMILLFSSIGLVSSRQQVIEIGLLNYLWPSLTIIFSILIFNYDFKYWLIPGLLFATVGVYLASLQNDSISFTETLINFRQNWFPYLLALGAAISWGFYSNLSRLWGSKSSASGMPLFILATGILIFLVRLFVNETSIWDAESITGVVYMSIFPTFLGYQFWDKAMQKGDIILVASFSYFTPVLATVFSCMYLDLNCGWIIWLACGLVLAGSVITKLSIKNNQQNLT